MWRDTRLSTNILLMGPTVADVQALDAELDTHPPRQTQWVLLDAGARQFSRQQLSNGSLTIWPGADPKALRQGLGQFHGVFFDVDLSQANALTQDWGKALRAHVWRETWLHCPGGLGVRTQAQWQALGWQTRDANTAVFQPPWAACESPEEAQRHITLIGAGLAGAACAYLLSQRGWQVDWLEAGPDLASGASGLPVGMLSPHRTAQPTPMSTLAELALPYTLKALQTLLPSGEGWCPTQIDNLPSEHGGPPAGRDHAWLVEPRVLVRAWWRAAMASGRVRWRSDAAVATLVRADQAWHCRDAQARTLSTAPQVLVANAFAARALLGPALGDIRAVAGQMSWANWPTHQTPCAPHPRRSHGVLTPSFHSSRGHIWAVGSTYRRGERDTTVQEADHDANADSLHRLCPEAVHHFQTQRERGEMHAFVGVRCASKDRLPLIGAVPTLDATWPARGGIAAVPRQPGLYALTALGSRGLTLAAWAAETLVDQIEGKPLASPTTLVQACDPGRKGLLRRAE